MRKIILIGRSGSGKSTLTQVMNQQEIEYKKTQTMEYYNSILDTPGEYLENPRFYKALITASYDCDVIGLVLDCTDDRSLYPPNFASIFNKPTIGIITKIDLKPDNVTWHEECLRAAGAEEIFSVSSYNHEGINQVQEYLTNSMLYHTLR
ncbi:EutP/PduV family microcompartment system protein [Vallitalea okinawensis]|uniref:EutP/PduV family microcompartment system protein n=1 Tax=Vallitalea okinawensis TaxID=2078660 RepID=UPI000CFA95D4|nr:EutP/PduV family microcompartment system protein [Vallitalea okinawensis]